MSEQTPEEDGYREYLEAVGDAAQAEAQAENDRNKEKEQAIKKLACIICADKGSRCVNRAVLSKCIVYAKHARRVWDAGYRLIDSNRPKIICLCGSTRFSDAFIKAFLDETLEGNIVLTVGNDWREKRQWQEIDPQKKIMLDELHKRKIDLADEVLILNVGGYIGESTRSEINYAIAHGKPIKYLEQQLEG
jgi:hypothetical protein